MVAPLHFSDVLDAALGTGSVASTRRAEAPRLDLGLSAGVWRALQPERPVALATTQPVPEPASQQLPSVEWSWSARQEEALQCFRDLGAPDLGVAPDGDTVKRAYWRLAKVHHPDMAQHSDPAAFCRLRAAWEILRAGPIPAKTGSFSPLRNKKS